MKFKIVADSCCDLEENSSIGKIVNIVPLTLYIDDKEIVDDDTFDQLGFIKDVAESKNCPKSSCPAPGVYMEAYEGDYDCVFVVTLSANLSGSYNSAEVGRQMYYDEHPDDKKQIHVFDSCSASAGEGLIAKRIYELASSGSEDFDSIVKKVNEYKLEMKTYFVIETLETLRKNGRLSALQAIITSVLNIKPIMAGNDEGVIVKLDQARGMERALKKLAEIIAKEVKNPAEKVMSITYCNCRERALWMKNEILKLVTFKDITIGPTRGVATMYANDGGIIISV